MQDICLSAAACAPTAADRESDGCTLVEIA
ncbi:MAG: hypothetical protein JWO56_3695, partial [Acidobacteria bacterium]|nr:hypothetical protein [Acidobacteriota bacterium]